MSNADKFIPGQRVKCISDYCAENILFKDAIYEIESIFYDNDTKFIKLRYINGNWLVNRFTIEDSAIPDTITVKMSDLMEIYRAGYNNENKQFFGYEHLGFVDLLYSLLNKDKSFSENDFAAYDDIRTYVRKNF